MFSASNRGCIETRSLSELLSKELISLSPFRWIQSEKLLLFDNMQNELLERIQRLEEDKQSIDITSGQYSNAVASYSMHRSSPVLIV